MQKWPLPSLYHPATTPARTTPTDHPQAEQAIDPKGQCDGWRSHSNMLHLGRRVAASVILRARSGDATLRALSTLPPNPGLQDFVRQAVEVRDAEGSGRCDKATPGARSHLIALGGDAGGGRQQ